MDTYIVIITLMGLAFLGAAWLPRLVDEAPLSFPILYVAAGVLLFVLPLGIYLPNPLESGVFTQHFTEAILIIALTGAGLKLARPVGWQRWSLTWRLLGIGMPLCMVATAFVGWWIVGLPPAAALLLGAVLAPTDPVLASDVQAGAPGEEEGGDVRFALTSEAGLNDGLAFPFVNLAIAVAAAEAASTAWLSNWQAWLLDWFLTDVLYKLAVGLVAGIGIGYLLALIFFRVASFYSARSTREAFVVLSITFLTYGITELLHGYGFLAVFIAAVVIRQNERSHSYHAELHDFSEGFERILMALMLILFGGLIGEGLLGNLTWAAAAGGLIVVFVLRPATGLLALAGSKSLRSERAVISFFGIRGIGSLFYLAYALNHHAFEEFGLLWSTVAYVVLLSIFVHGTSATLAMRHVDQRRVPAGSS